MSEYKGIYDFVNRGYKKTDDDKQKEITAYRDQFHKHVRENFNLPLLLAQIARVKAVKDPQGRYSPSQTLLHLKNSKETFDSGLTGEDLYWIARFIGIYSSPSQFKIGVSNADKPYYCRLVPLVMSAYKKYQGINYSEWNSADKDFRVLVGDILFHSLEEPSYRKASLKKRLFDVSDFRKQVIESCKTARVLSPKATNCSSRQIKYGAVDPIEFPAYEPAKYILSQTWMAHHSMRNEYMLLDLEDFDAMPKPFDEVVEEPIELEDGFGSIFKGLTKVSNKKQATIDTTELPWS